MTETATSRAADQAREKAQETRGLVRDRVRDEVDRRSTQAGDQAGSTAQALRQASDRLRQEGSEPVAKGMERVAERVEGIGSWLRDSDGDTILRDVEDFGRRNPLAVVAGGVALGFAASRLLKASSRSRYQSSGNGTNTTLARTSTAPRETPDRAPEPSMDPLLGGGIGGREPVDPALGVH
jgi:hypothetical protein